MTTIDWDDDERYERRKKLTENVLSDAGWAVDRIEELAEIDALRARHDITVEGIVALVDGILDGTALTSLGWHDESLKPDDQMVAYWLGADRLLACARRLARGEDA